MSFLRLNVLSAYVFLLAAIAAVSTPPAHAAKVDPACAVALDEALRDDPILKNLPENPGLKGTIAALSAREADARKALGTTPVKLTKKFEKFRDRWVPFLKADKTLRESLVRAMESELRVRSAALKRRLAAQARSGETIQYDSVIVGAGVHGILSAAKQLADNPNLRILIVEGSDTGAATFRYAGDTFNINSSNRASGPGQIPLPGKGNINELPGLPVQVSDLSANKYPTAGDLSTALVTGLYATVTSYDVDILLNTDALSVDEEVVSPAPFANRHKLRFGETRKTTIAVESKKTTVASGFGKPSLPRGVAKGIEANPELIASKDITKTLPRVLTFEDVMRVLAQNEDPRKYFAGKKVAVVGTGDSANVFIEFLLGYSTPTAYGFSDAQTPGPQSIFWVGQTITSCEDFIAQARSRYAQIGTGYRSSDPTAIPVLKGIPFRLSGVSPTAKEQVRLDLTNQNGGPGSPIDADVVILATGFEGGLRDLLGGLFPESKGKYQNDAAFLAENFDFLEAKTTTSDGKDTRVARAAKRFDSRGRVIRANPNTLIVGPAAGKLPQDSELVGIIQNTVSIFNNAPRTVAAAAITANGVAKPVKKPEAPAAFALKSASPRDFVVTGTSQTRPLGFVTTEYLQSTLASAARQFEGPRGPLELDVQIFLTASGDVAMRSGTPVDLAPLVTVLAETREFFDQAAVLLKSNPGILIEGRLVLGAKGNAKVAYDRISDRSVRGVAPVKNGSIALRGIEDFQ